MREDKLWLMHCQQDTCAGCKKKLSYKAATIDHIKPRSKGGSNKLSNKQIMCKVCNRKKGNRHEMA